MQAVSIIVPTRNEADNIDLLLRRIFAVEKLRGLDLEVVFSDGNSTDGTCERIAKWSASHKVRVVRSAVNEGLSAAVMAGARAASGEFVVVMDADLSHPPEVIPDLLEPLLSQNFDMVIGSRYVNGGSMPDWPFSRKISSFLATLPARLFTDVKDPLAGFIAVRRERLASMNREVFGFKIGLELLATEEQRMRVKEVPITFRERCHGLSKMSMSVILDYFRQLLILAGVYLLPCRFQLLFQVLLASLITDTCLFTFFLEQGIRPGWAHFLSFIPASALVGGVMWWRYRSNLQAEGSGQVSHMTELILGFFWITLLSLFLRSGLVAVLSSAGSEFSTAAVFLTGVAGVGLSYVGNVFYVFSIGKKRIRGVLVQRFYGIGLALYLALLRLVYSAGMGLLPEEQYYAGLLSESQPFTRVPETSSMALAGTVGEAIVYNSSLAFRMANWGLWFIAAVCVFNLTRDMYDRSVAFRAFLLFSVLPFFVGTGLFISSDAVLSVFWCGSIYLLNCALVRGNASAWIWLGGVLGFGIQFNLMLAILLPATILYLLVSKEDQKWLNRRELYVGLAVMLLTVLPVIIVGGVGPPEPYTGPDWLESILGVSLSRNYLVAFLLLTPTGVLAGGHCFMKWMRMQTELQDSVGSKSRKTRTFLLTIFLVPLVLMLIPGLTAKSAVYAGSIVWIALLPCMALTFSAQVPGKKPISRLLNTLWWPTIVVLVMIYGVSLHLTVL